MSVFAPDDFNDDPYQAGINQIGHIMFGAAIMALVGNYILAGFLFIAWEWYQRRFMGAKKSDYYADCAFWLFGVLAFDWHYFAPCAIVLGGAWMVVKWLGMKRNA